MSTNLIEYYKDTLKSVGLSITPDDYVSVNGIKRITYKGLPLALPTEDHCGSMKTLDKDTMEMKISKVLFNPLSESVHGITPGMEILQKKITLSTSMTLSHVFRYLTHLLVTPALQGNLSLELTKFFSVLATHHTRKNSKLYGKDTEKHILKIIDNKKIKLIHIREKEKENKHKVLIVSFPLYDTLNNTGSMKIIHKNKTIEGSSITPTKDIPILKSIYDYLFGDIDLEFSANSKEFPTYKIYMKFWLTIYGRLQDVLKELRFMDSEAIDVMIVEMVMGYRELSTIYLKRFRTELGNIPKDISDTPIKLTPIRKKKPTTTVMNLNIDDDDVSDNQQHQTRPINKTGVVSGSDFLKSYKKHRPQIHQNVNGIDPNVIRPQQASIPYGGNGVATPYGTTTPPIPPYGHLQPQQGYSQSQQGFPLHNGHMDRPQQTSIPYGGNRVATPYGTTTPSIPQGYSQPQGGAGLPPGIY